MTNKETFAALYAESFKESYPHLDIQKTEHLIQKATETALNNIRSVLIDTPAFKLTCKKLGIKNTYIAIEQYLKG